MSRTVCRQERSVRYRQYDGRGRRYTVYDVSTAVAPAWFLCDRKMCRSYSHSFKFTAPTRCSLFSNNTGYNLRTRTNLGERVFNVSGSTTVKPVLFACPLFREFRDLGNLAKITGR